jgi:hypothetical protein
MSLFPPEMPRPSANMDDQGFWERCARKELCFQTCAVCGTPRHPPTPVCFRCHSSRTTWTAATEGASVYSYTIVHHASHPAVGESLPYVCAVVEFAGLPGVRLITNVTDVNPRDVRIGMPVRLWWDDIGDGMEIPRFRPAS